MEAFPCVWCVALRREKHELHSCRFAHVLQLHNDRYIHKSFCINIQGYKQQRAFIIAQSPMESTARDFWKMVHDRKCGVIVMLCDLVEDGQVATLHLYLSLLCHKTTGDVLSVLASDWNG